jgi:hypothetical protein
MKLNEPGSIFRRSDVYEHLLGEKVVVYTKGHIPLGGVLKDFNGVALHLTSDNGIENTYVFIDHVVGISGNR